MIPCGSKPVPVLTKKILEADRSVVVVSTSEITLEKATATKTGDELHVAKQLWLKPEDIETVMAVSKGTGLFYFSLPLTVI